MSDISAWLAGKYDLPGDQQVAQGRARLSCPDRRHPFSFAVVGVDARGSRSPTPPRRPDCARSKLSTNSLRPGTRSITTGRSATSACTRSTIRLTAVVSLVELSASTQRWWPTKYLIGSTAASGTIESGDLTDHVPNLDENGAYKLQVAYARRRAQRGGERLLAAFTNAAMLRMYNMTGPTNRQPVEPQLL